MTSTASGPADRPDDMVEGRHTDPFQDRPTDSFDDRADTSVEDRPDGSLDDRPNDQFDDGSQAQTDDRPQDENMAAAPDTAGAANDEPVRLLQADELQTIVSRWREIQAEFVDQPKRAMHDADELVSELMDRLSRTFAEQREQLESRWSDADTISTEELRQGLQRYRSFF